MARAREEEKRYSALRKSPSCVGGKYPAGDGEQIEQGTCSNRKPT